MADKTQQRIEAHLAALVRIELRRLEIASGGRTNDPTEHAPADIDQEHRAALAALEEG